MSSSESLSSTATSTSTSTSTETGHPTSTAPASYKIIGVSLAIVSGLLIGASFVRPSFLPQTHMTPGTDLSTFAWMCKVVKKKGLINATKKSGNLAGEGHAYLKNWIWWTGMSMMIVGEICNFAAFAFTAAILVTPLGALSVVVCAIMSKFFLSETLTFFGWLGCALVILGATILALNAPETQSAETIPVFQKLWISPGFLSWAGICIIASLVLAFYAGPKWGKTNQFVYIGICSLIGGLSVSTLQGVGAAIMTSIRGDSQFRHWFLYVVTVFTIITLLIEINYLNKALELFNTSMVTPTYYVMFTSCTLISSFILYQGLKTSAVSLVTMIMGFLVTCLGITLLQMSKVDPKNFEKLDRRSTMLMAASRSQAEDVEKNNITGLEEPGMDALRGGFGTVGSILRARSARRLSNASSLPGRPLPSRMASSNTYSQPWQNEGNTDPSSLPRYSLSDGPMSFADDTFDQVSLHSAPSSAAHGQRRATLKFDDNDTVHQYDRKGKVGALHTSHMHVHAGEDPTSSPGRPTFGNRGYSGSSIVPIPEMPETASQMIAAHERRNNYGRDLTTSPPTGNENAALPTLEYDVTEQPPPPNLGIPASGSSRASFHTILNRFTNSDAPDLHLNPRRGSKDREQKRNRSHKANKDYPHLRKDEAEMDKEERQGLVMASDDEEVSAPSDRSVSGSPESMQDKRKTRKSSRQQNSISSMPRPLPYLPNATAGGENSYPPS